MNITYIHHSSFLVEEASVFLLFDYTEGKIPPIPSDAPLYVLVSHSHGDHFSPAIFDLGKKHPRIRFLLSSDISVKSVPQEYLNDPDRLIFLPPHTVWEDSLLKVETFASNDLGVAFWCTLGNRQIYHAGDLNNWFWEGDEEDLRLQEMYHTELKKMAGRTADVAFVPLDPRLGDAFCLGVDDFTRYIRVKNLFPMHFWGDFSVSKRLKHLPCSEGYRDLIREIHQDGESFTV